MQWFQFHEGPIKTVLGRFRPTAELGFNSMKVRLKPASGMMLTSCENGFNSMKVRLKRHIALQAQRNLSVSIP